MDRFGNARFGLLLALFLTGSVCPSFAGDTEPDVAACRDLMAGYGRGLATTEAKNLSASLIGFGLDLHRRLYQTNPTHSLTTSPFSILSILGMALNGAGGRSLEELARFLRLKDGSDPFNVGYSEIISSLRSIGPGSTLSFGNLVIADKAFPLLPEFILNVTAQMGGAAENHNFADRTGLLARINGYIEEQTDHRIRDLVRDAPTAAALINAGYFKGTWALLFDENETVEKYPFTLEAGVAGPVPMMFHRQKTFLYYQAASFQCVSLAYKSGDFAMDLFVPDPIDRSPVKAVQELMGQLTGEQYQRILSELRPTKLSKLGLPRWEAGSRLGEAFKTALQRAIPSLFDPKSSDLSRMSKERAFFSEVVHATQVQTNELGSKGSFVTYGGLRPTTVFKSP